MKNQVTTQVTTAILPVAGRGSRVMPLTLHQPKAMIGIVDKPMVHYLIDEIIAAGIKHIIIVIAPSQKVFKDYLKHIQQDPEWKKLGVKIDFAIQKIAKGNGHALLPAEKFIKKGEGFLVAFADDIIPFRKSPIKKMIDLYKKESSPVIMLEEVPKKLVHKYGVIKGSPSTSSGSNVYKINDLVEKPRPEKAPSNKIIVGRYVLPHTIYKHIKTLNKKLKKTPKEVYLADALKMYIQQDGDLYGWLYDGPKFDAGSKIGLLKAQAYFGIHHKEFKQDFKKYLKSLK